MINILRRTAAESWALNSGWGNHRAVVRVDQPCDVAIAAIEWRRRDLEPENVGVRVKYLATDEEIKDVYILKATREEGEIIFKAPYEGLYGIYYLPFIIKGEVWALPEVQYMKKEEMACNPAWNGAPESSFPKAELVAIESRTDFDRFYPMEVPATSKEIQKLIGENEGEAFLLFPEKRTHSIRMLKDLPQCWVERGPQLYFKDSVHPGEYYVFQIGIWALWDLLDLHVAFEQPEENRKLPFSAFTCFNIEGIDWLGRSFTRDLTVEANSIQSLWFGVDLPEDIEGQYEFHITISNSCAVKTVHVVLDVEGETLPNRGDGDLWRLSRLRWLNSTIGSNGEAAKGYPEIEVQGKSVMCWGREVSFSDMGLPSAIRSFFTPNVSGVGDKAEEIIANPVEMRITSGGNILDWITGAVQVDMVAPGRVLVKADMSAEGLSGSSQASMEYDGHIDTVITLTAQKNINIDNFQLLIPIRKEAATYMMGMGKQGGIRPAEWQYKWDIDRANNMVWVGAPHAGVQIKLKHTQDVWEICNYRNQGLPASWSNNGMGGCSITENGNCVLVDAFSGPLILKAGENISWRFSLLVTPLKPVNTDLHWCQRYHHIDTWKDDIPSLPEAVKAGATVVNLHQGGSLNLYINYPFFKSKDLREQTALAHEMGLKYKIYYTVRELSNRAQELWMLRSLGDEVLRVGLGFHVADHFLEERHHSMTGGPWLCEHLTEGFIPAWQQILPGGDYDSAVAMVGLSRWHNYYLEGLAWLILEDGLDGIYLDGAGYDRQIMKRVRKAMDLVKDGCLIDFHSGNNFELQYGLNSPMNQYLELMPSVDSLWLGEYYDYEKQPPDYWLTEISGIPFGLMGDMLHNGGNPWRGMVFGMTCRYGWQQGGNPVPLWQFWESFGLVGSRMHGWWSEGCPVTTDNNDIKATVYIKSDKTLVSIASWASETVWVNIEVNWPALGLLAESVIIEASGIENFQNARVFERDESIPVEPGRGWLLVVRNKL
jgi:hypothetical protein